ncbi:hypothetical protein IOD13_09340 [Brevibacterium casei]|nr:hypothetical protein [Brevibacterium casei]
MPSASAKSPASQLLSAFLSAVLPPTDVRRVAELLSFEIGMRPDSSFPIRLVPNRVATTLLTALTQEPGVSGDPESAWMSAMDVLNNPEPDPAARELDKYLRTAPPLISDDQVDLSGLEPALTWLSARLLALRHGLPSTSAESAKRLADVQSFLADASGHVDSVRAASPSSMRTSSVSESFSTSSTARAGTAVSNDRNTGRPVDRRDRPRADPNRNRHRAVVVCPSRRRS